MNYARRQQYRRLSKAGAAAAASRCCGIDGSRARERWSDVVRRCRRCRCGRARPVRPPLAGAGRAEQIGARSEDEVRHQLAALEHEGWRLRHSLRWRGRGDIDSLAIAPSGLAFAIETKTRTYNDRHLAVVQQQAAWLLRRRRRWCRLGAMPVLCVVRAAAVQRWQRGVLVVSLEALIPTLRHVAAETLHPVPSIDR